MLKSGANSSRQLNGMRIGVSVKIPVDKVGIVIGKVIRKIREAICSNG